MGGWAYGDVIGIIADMVFNCLNLLFFRCDVNVMLRYYFPVKDVTEKLWCYTLVNEKDDVVRLGAAILHNCVMTSKSKTYENYLRFGFES